MQTIEIVVFMGISLLIAGMMILFLNEFDFGAVQETFTNIMMPNSSYDSKNVQKVTFLESIKILNSCWGECAMGDLNAYCGAILIQTNDFNALNTTLSQSDFEEVFEKYNFCTNCKIQMTEELNVPGIISAECKNGSIIITK